MAGLVGVLEFHTRPAPISLGTLPGRRRHGDRPRPPPAPAGTPRAPGQRHGGPSPNPGSPAASSRARPGRPSGPAVNYSWGVLSVTVTVSGSKIVKVGIASLDDGGNPRSQSIDQQAIPMLEQQAMQAQSANIQGVSGASYTSAGFAQSLQSALHKLGFQ